MRPRPCGYGGPRPGRLSAECLDRVPSRAVTGVGGAVSAALTTAPAHGAVPVRYVGVGDRVRVVAAAEPLAHGSLGAQVRAPAAPAGHRSSRTREPVPDQPDGIGVRVGTGQDLNDSKSTVPTTRRGTSQKREAAGGMDTPVETGPNAGVPVTGRDTGLGRLGRDGDGDGDGDGDEHRCSLAMRCGDGTAGKRGVSSLPWPMNPTMAPAGQGAGPLLGAGRLCDAGGVAGQERRGFRWRGP